MQFLIFVLTANQLIKIQKALSVPHFLLKAIKNLCMVNQNGLCYRAFVGCVSPDTLNSVTIMFQTSDMIGVSICFL